MLSPDYLENELPTLVEIPIEEIRKQKVILQAKFIKLIEMLRHKMPMPSGLFN